MFQALIGTVETHDASSGIAPFALVSSPHRYCRNTVHLADLAGRVLRFKPS